MENPTRVRLVFEDRKLLRKAQRRDGLLRCWIQLRPTIATVSDLAAHISACFGLSCPDGLILSVHGFVLPSFQSASIVKNEDIVSVRQRGVMVKEFAHICDRDHHMEDHANVVKKPIEVKCLALAKVQEVSDEYREFSPSKEANSRKKKRKREIPEEATNSDEEISPDSEKNALFSLRGGNSKGGLEKRRKAFTLSIDKTSTNIDDRCLDDLCAGKERKMKHKPDIPKDVTNSDLGNNSDSEKREFGSPKGDSSRKNLRKKQKAFTCNIAKATTKTDMNDLSVGNERCNAVEVNFQRDALETPACGIKKFPSRSARRKKAKREWMRNLAKSQKQQDQNHLPPDGLQSLNYKENIKNRKCQEIVERGWYKEKHQSVQHLVTNDILEEEIVPVVVRPGHLRFVTLDEHNDEEVRPGVEPLLWNGITSKKKGQKWGLEKYSSKGSIDGDFNKIYEEMVVDEEKQVVDNEENFEELMPLTREPKETDVIAYRLVELSSSWCPELSSFRAGKITSYDNISKKVCITPLPEYSNFLGENEEESCQPPISLYAEDGSLEIDFTSLVDVRLFEVKEAADCAENVAAAEDTEHASNSDVALSKCNITSAVTSTSGWEEVREELEERKSQIMKNNASKLPFKAVKGSGLGCTMALLRAQHDLQE